MLLSICASKSHKIILATCVCLLIIHCAQAQDVPIRADFSADRVYVQPITSTGDTLRLLTDSGGGTAFLQSASKRLNFAAEDSARIGGRIVPLVAWPDMQGHFPAGPDHVPVLPADRQSTLLQMGDGMLGRQWFAGRVWTFDYGGERLVRRDTASMPELGALHTIELGFKANLDGERAEHFPRVEVAIDGKAHDFLLDTGASMVLTDSAHSARGGPRVRGTSFVTASLFDQWRQAHPEWTVKYDEVVSGPVIEVPSVTVAGHTVGPVEFVRRPDAAFHQRMSSLMDRRPDGAIGGSVLRYFVVTLDYPGAQANFELVTGGDGADAIGEGFYEPDKLPLPDPVSGALRSVVRVKPDIRFRAILVSSRAQAQARRSGNNSRKEFQPNGGVIWNTPIDTTTLEMLCDNPVARVQPGFKELCDLDWRTKCDEFPCALATQRLSGSGTGVVVGRSPKHGVLVATPYHVARESIERRKRTEGMRSLRPVEAPDISIGLDTNGPHQPGGYVYTEDVTLLANASEAEWQDGRDWALLAVPYSFSSHVRSARVSTEVPEEGDKLWAAGFPYRTIRPDSSRSGYRNATNELRISVGRAVSRDTVRSDEMADTDIISTLDAVNGSSGSPVFDNHGQVVGMVRHGYCEEGGGELNIRIRRYCGVTLITPLDPVTQLLK